MLNAVRQLNNIVEYNISSLPLFVKSEDDRRPLELCRACPAAVDIILVEVGCVCTARQPEQLLAEPVNALEDCEDADMQWREYVNESLAGEYRELNALIDVLVMLKAPDFETVYDWRSLQESKLRDSNPDAKQLMSEVELMRFIQHYERLTRHNLKELPKLADALFCFDHNHHISSASYQRKLSR